jgi:hypothetical protein
VVVLVYIPTSSVGGTLCLRCLALIIDGTGQSLNVVLDAVKRQQYEMSEVLLM